MRNFFATVLLVLLLQGCATAPLHQAAVKGDKSGVQSLLDKGAKVDQTDNRGRTALYLAAQKGQAEVVKLLLSKGANPTHRCLFYHGNTPLHAAAQNGHNDIIKLLLTSNISPDLLNHLRQTPLMLAAWARLPDTVAMLLENGADPKLQDDNGWSVLHSDWRPKPGNASYEEVMELLISSKAPVNAASRNPIGCTPLMSACLVGDLIVVKLLLDAGAEINAADEFGRYPYQIALQTHNRPLMDLLIERGALTKASFHPAVKKPDPKIPKTDQ